MANRLDDLARSLATPVSRRRALRLTAAAALGVDLAARTTPAPAARQPLDGCPTCPPRQRPAGVQPVLRARARRRLPVRLLPGRPTRAARRMPAWSAAGRATSAARSSTTCLVPCKNDCGGACCEDGESASTRSPAGAARPLRQGVLPARTRSAPTRSAGLLQEVQRARVHRQEPDDLLRRQPREVLCGPRVTQCCGYGETCDQDSAAASAGRASRSRASTTAAAAPTSAATARAAAASAPRRAGSAAATPWRSTSRSAASAGSRSTRGSSAAAACPASARGRRSAAGRLLPGGLELLRARLLRVRRHPARAGAAVRPHSRPPRAGRAPRTRVAPAPDARAVSRPAADR